jgi:hypothetical protein
MPALQKAGFFMETDFLILLWNQAVKKFCAQREEKYG